MDQGTKEVCKDYGDNPSCLKDTDERYTMDFSDVPDGGFIYWCAYCGPIAHNMQAAINEAFLTRPDFADELKAAIDKVQEENKSKAH